MKVKIEELLNEIVKINYTVDNIEYLILKRNIDKNQRLVLRGQPSPNSNMTVVRTEFSNKEWELWGDYINSQIFNLPHLWFMQFEGRSCSCLYLHSKSLGWISVDPKGNDYYKEGYDSFYDMYYQGPTDIDKVMFE